ncbi:MAG: acetate--CoA ligase family protein [Candidatus Bathyarchaeia archaeon]
MSEIIAKALAEGRRYLLEHEAKAICQKYGIPVTRFGVAGSAEEAAKIAEEIGFPVVLKIVSPDIVHKYDVGGVVLNLKSADEVINAYNQIIANVRKRRPEARIDGVNVQEMAPPSTEVIVGAVKDPQFGPVLMFGLGGIFVEVLKDVTYRVAPIKEDDALEMVNEIKASPILKGYRGLPPADVNAIVEILLNASKMMMENQEIRELDLNPIMVYEKGAKTVDARIILG